MAVAIVVPSVGESVTEGRLSRWLKPDGSTVQVDEPICELETDKATAEIAAPSAGILRHGAGLGATVAIGAVIGRIEAGGSVAMPASATKAASTTSGAKSSTTAMTSPSPLAPRIGAVNDGPVLSPAARRAADEAGIDPTAISGTGRGGRIIKEDVQAIASIPKPPTQSLSTPAPTPVPSPITPVSETSGSARSSVVSRDRSEKRTPMTSIRRRIAERLVESQQTTATLTTFNEADMSAVMALREKFKDAFKEKHGVGLGFMSFFVRAAIEALRTHPIVNARLDGADIVEQSFFDIGVAVSTERGLMVPVLRDADQMSFAGIEKRISELAVKARDGKIAVADLQGGTFTITNGGTFGSMMSTPILNPPQTAVLGMHAIIKRPVALNDQVVIRPMMYLALSYDHRLIDGREAVRFLVRIKECVENPERMLLDL